MTSKISTDLGSFPLVWVVPLALYLMTFVLGFGAALALHKPFPGRGIVRAILLIPWVISAVAAAYVWRWILHSDYGLVSGSLMEWGWIEKPLVLLDNKNRVMPTLIMVNVWKEFPFVMVMLTAGLQTVPEGLLRAARIDGASTWNQFWHVTVPHLRGAHLRAQGHRRPVQRHVVLRARLDPVVAALEPAELPDGPTEAAAVLRPVHLPVLAGR